MLVSGTCFERSAFPSLVIWRETCSVYIWLKLSCKLNVVFNIGPSFEQSCHIFKKIMTFPCIKKYIIIFLNCIIQEKYIVEFWKHLWIMTILVYTMLHHFTNHRDTWWQNGERALCSQRGRGWLERHLLRVSWPWVSATVDVRLWRIVWWHNGKISQWGVLFVTTRKPLFKKNINTLE